MIEFVLEHITSNEQDPDADVLLLTASALDAFLPRSDDTALVPRVLFLSDSDERVPLANKIERNYKGSVMVARVPLQEITPDIKARFDVTALPSLVVATAQSLSQGHTALPSIILSALFKIILL